MALLMWRGNYQQDLGRAGGRRSEEGLRDEPGGARSAAAGCPLVLAVSTGSIEMVRLLLEFGDPSSSAAPCSFDLNGALIAALSLGGKYEELLSDDWHYDDSSRLELLRLLVESGADPHAPPSGAAGLSPLSPVVTASRTRSSAPARSACQPGLRPPRHAKPSALSGLPDGRIVMQFGV